MTKHLLKAALIVAVFAAGIFTGGVLMQAQSAAPAAGPAERVTGIGGIFFKAKDPKTLAAWYRDALGVALQDGAPLSIFAWRETGEPSKPAHTAWSIFPATTKYFGAGGSSCMLNYRVRNLDRMLAQLRALGVQVDEKIEEDFNGRFASIVDPEGNKVQLWEPKEGY
jgi:predicted enzyme related to lactoylglutathione lyase